MALIKANMCTTENVQEYDQHQTTLNVRNFTYVLQLENNN